MVMLEPLISLIVCSCLGGEARRPGPDPTTDWHGLVRGEREGGRREVEKQEEGREGMKEQVKEKVRGKSGGVIRISSVGLLTSLQTHPLVTKMADLQ